MKALINKFIDCPTYGDHSVLKYHQNNHYQGLDFLRGVAALGVVWFHCAVRLDLPYLAPHGYLAVDFFFVLSGFVISLAYYRRLNSGVITLRRFALIRIIRLMPLIVLGTCLSAVVEIGRPGVQDQGQHLSDAVQALVFGLLLIPILRPTTLEFTIFPLNGPVWSLFLEVIVNACFALWASIKIRPGLLMPLFVISAAVVLWGIHLNGRVDVGHSPSDLWLGFARISYSFIAGVAIYYIKDKIRNIPIWIPTAILLFIFSFPILESINTMYDSICVIFILPLIVLLASSNKIGLCTQRWAVLSGNISYPLYALHYPLIRVFGVIGSSLQFGLVGRLGLVVAATSLSIFISICAYIFFDIPVRKKLGDIFLRRKQSGLV